VRISGRPLLHASVTRASEIAGNALVVVLGSGAAELAPLLKHSPGTIVINQEWREGLASSIRAGIARLQGTCAGALLLLADQPAVSVEDLRRLEGTWRRQPLHIAAASTAAPRTAGHLSRSLFPQLGRLRGDGGTRALLPH
jgi:molybdenum cofactor cytidylyltransferase